MHSRTGEAAAEAGLDAACPGHAARSCSARCRLPPSRPPPATRGTEQPSRKVGQILFTALLGTGEVAGRYRASAALAAERGRQLRVVLQIGSLELAGLLWEAMRDKGTGAYGPSKAAK